MSTCLGIELGSTRIKAVTIDGGFKPVSSGDYTWASRYENGGVDLPPGGGMDRAEGRPVPGGKPGTASPPPGCPP